MKDSVDANPVRNLSSQAIDAARPQRRFLPTHSLAQECVSASCPTLARRPKPSDSATRGNMDQFFDMRHPSMAFPEVGSRWFLGNFSGTRCPLQTRLYFSCIILTACSPVQGPDCGSQHQRLGASLLLRYRLFQRQCVAPGSSIARFRPMMIEMHPQCAHRNCTFQGSEECPRAMIRMLCLVDMYCPGMDTTLPQNGTQRQNDINALFGSACLFARPASRTDF